MPSWKKILQSGSAVDVLNITASSLPNSSQPNVIGYDTASGRFTFFPTSSIAGSGGSTIGGSGTENYITRWSSGTTITTSSIYESSSRIGIGTTSPQGPLHIRGVSDSGVTPGIFLDSNGFDNNEPFDIRLASAAVGAAQARGIRIIASSSLSGTPGGAAISVYNITSSAFPGWVFIDSGAHNGAKILFRTAATNGAISAGERMVISSSGNVGIGTSTPTTTLNVNGTTLLQGGQTTVRGNTATSAATALRVENNNATSLLTILNDGTSAFNTNHLYVSSSGLVGIGTTTPGVTLDVIGSIRANSFMFNSTTQTQTIRINSTTHLAFQNTSSVEVARFNNAGNWGIGTTSPTERLHVDGNMIVTGRITAEEFHTEFVSSSIIYQSGSTQFGNSSDDTHQFTGSLSVNGSITGSLFGTASWATNVVNNGVTSIATSGTVSGITLTGGTITSTGTITLGGSISGLTNSNLSGTAGITNANLANSSVSLGSQTLTLGAAATTTLTGLTSITATSFTGSLFGTASIAVNAQTASFLPVGTYSITSSQAINAQTASNITPSITNNTDNRVLTATGGGTINGESGLTFDGSVLTVTGRANISTSITSSTATIGVGLTSALNAGQTTIRGSGVDTAGALTIQNSAGTGTFTVLNGGTTGVGENNPSARLHVKGTGATSATTALRVENSAATARLTILDNGTSAFNTSHLYVSGSGIIGIGTSTPTMGVLDINGITRIRSTLYFGGTGAGDWQGAISGQASGLLVNANLLTINNSGYASPATQSFLINTSQNVAIGPHSPTARLHVSGANNQSLLQVSSPTNQNILFVTGSGRVGINTTSPMAFFAGSGGVFGSGEGNITPTLTIFQSSSLTGLNSAGLQIVGSGSSPYAAARLNILTMGDKFAYLNIGTSGSGTENNYWEFAKSNSGYAHSLFLSNYSNGVYQSSIFQFVPGAATSYIGTGNQISLEGATGYIGLQTGNPGTQEWIHLHSEPADGNYLQIDAAQFSNNPPLTNASAKAGFGITANSRYLAEPDYWMEIKIYNGDIVLIPCYLPEV